LAQFFGRSLHTYSNFLHSFFIYEKGAAERWQKRDSGTLRAVKADVSKCSSSHPLGAAVRANVSEFQLGAEQKQEQLRDK
jgi:hypothetical protein